jgi:hypothetical protein
MRRSRSLWGEAAAFREETGKSIGRASRGMGPSACARIAETTSGRAISQQGLATTCKDSSDEGKPEVGERDLAWRMSPSEQRRRGNALREDPGDPPWWGNTPAGQRGSRHLAGSRLPPDRAQTRVSGCLEGMSRAAKQTMSVRGGCAPALELRPTWEGIVGISQGRQPDSGNPTVRDERGGLGKRDHGSRTEVHGESCEDTTGPYRARARDLSRLWRSARVTSPRNCFIEWGFTVRS